MITFSQFVHVETSRPRIPDVYLQVNTYRSTRTDFPDLGRRRPRIKCAKANLRQARGICGQQ